MVVLTMTIETTRRSIISTDDDKKILKSTYIDFNVYKTTAQSAFVLLVRYCRLSFTRWFDFHFKCVFFYTCFSSLVNTCNYAHVNHSICFACR